MATHVARVKRAQHLFGTICSIELAGARSVQLHEAAEAAFAEMGRIQGLMNPYDPDSELRRVVAQAVHGPTVASDELLAIIDVALWMARHTLGRYDPTVWPLLELWRACERSQCWPSEAELQEALRAVDYRRVHCDRQRRTLSVADSRVRLDLSSLVKGYALDCALAAACRFPIERALLNAGGELLAWDRNGEGVLVGLADPRDRSDLIGLIRLTNQAVATSGQGEPHLAIGGHIVGHLLDTRTGLPSLHDVFGSSVVAHSALLADVLSTACFVVGASEAQALLRGFPGAAGLVLRQDGRGTEWIVTHGFPLVERLELAGIEESQL
ncbi:MAG: FAD:protein FMN transferase [Candidatus Omnitrophica bacterium]|nr:FAD:protein FMN transferase [Candidatus Omnitrophota bacterium]